MARCLLFALCVTVVSAGAAWANPPLIETHGAMPSDVWTLEFQLENGFETGYLPDLFIAPRLTLTVPAGLRIGLTIDGTYLTDQGLSRIDRSGLDVSYDVLPGGSRLRLAAIAGGDFAWNDAVAVPYDGTTAGILKVTSPRTDTGFDLTGALAASLDLFELRSLDFALAGEVRYDYTGGRSSFETTNGFAAGTHRLSAVLAPEVGLSQKNLQFALQNRLLYWFDRGYGYELLPQVSWSPRNRWSMEGGIGIPMVGGGSWRFLLAAGFSLPLRPPGRSAANRRTAGKHETKRLVLNFQFEPDASDLLEPANTTYGKENAKLVEELVQILKGYPKASIVIEGNANRAKFSVSFEEEQERELVPLSKARAESVRKALIEAGIPASQLSTVGNGAAKPVVDFHDTENVWKNRRVEIVIQE